MFPRMQLTIDDLTQMIGDLKRRLSEIPTDSVEPSASARAAIELALQTVTLVNEVLPLLTSFQVTMATFNVPHAEAAKAGVKYVATKERTTRGASPAVSPPTPNAEIRPSDSAAEEERDGTLKRPGPDVPDGAQKRVKVAPTGADGNSSALDQPAGLYKATEPLQAQASPNAGSVSETPDDVRETTDEIREKKGKSPARGPVGPDPVGAAATTLAGRNVPRPESSGASGSKQDAPKAPASTARRASAHVTARPATDTVVVRGVARACDAKRRVLTGGHYPRPRGRAPNGRPYWDSDAGKFVAANEDARCPKKTPEKPSRTVPVIDEESPEKATQKAKTHAEQDAEAAARAQATAERAAAEARARDVARKRQEELARQARERQAAERAEAAAEKARQRKQNTKKAQKELLEEMRRKQEEESAQREHHARKAQTEQKIREKARITCVATATDEIYEAHVAAFEKMKTVPPGTLRERDVPWPHPNNLVFLTPRDDSNARKKKVMRAIQRWHPDKFTQNFGAAIREAERERIMTRVRGVSASVIELRQVWN